MRASCRISSVNQFIYSTRMMMHLRPGLLLHVPAPPITSSSAFAKRLSSSIRPQFPIHASFSRCALSLQEVQSCQDYLNYCKATNTSLHSTVFRGTMYEFAARHMLTSQFHCFNLTRSGGAGDYGVDLFGRWDLSQYPCLGKARANSLAARSQNDLASGVTVLVQCKNYNSKIGAAVVRELGGIYDFHVKTSADLRSTFLFLVSPEPLTRQAQAQLDTASVPMAHMRMRAMQPIAQEVYHLESWTGGEVVSAYLNRKARRLLHGLEVERELTQFRF